jgi:hypothetical protein
MRTAWEDSVNEEFVRRVGLALAAFSDTRDVDYIDGLIEDYESTIDTLPRWEHSEDYE